MIDKKSKRILRTAFTYGRVHDFKLFKRSKLRIHKDIKIIGDLGYLGIDKYHRNSVIPHKSSKLKPLTKLEKKQNRELSKQRIGVEHAFCRLKRFRIFSYPYRNRRKRFALRFNLFAAIYNMEI